MKIKHLSRVLRLKPGDRRHLRECLDRMVREGEIEKLRGGRFRLPPAEKEVKHTAASKSKAPPRDGRIFSEADTSRNRLVGRLITHRDGYGFVELEGLESRKGASPNPPAGPDQVKSKPRAHATRPSPPSGLVGSQIPFKGDVFIPPLQMRGALNGDQVVVEIDAIKRDGRAEGHIVKVLERKFSSVVGQFRRRGSTAVVMPLDEKFLHQVVIEAGEEGSAREGDIVDVEMTRFPTSLESPRGRVTEVLGKPGDFGIDVEIMIRKHHLPHRFPEEVLEAAREIPQQVSKDEAGRREDFRSLPIVTIDGETAKDFDDAVYVRRLENGNFELQVHIADVAHYVTRGSVLDSEALLRGTSVYFPDRAVPMLPEELSNGICSLNPKVDRLVQSCIMEIDSQGRVVDHRFAQGVIRSMERMTYTHVAKILVDSDESVMSRYAPLVETFHLMKDLATILNRMRDARGSIDFDLPEPVITFDENGIMTGVVRSERNIAHRIIEEFMLIANETVARELFDREIPTLYRIHETPDPAKVAEFEMIARSFGYSLGIDLVVKKLPVEKEARARERRGRSQRSGVRHSTPTGFAKPSLWLQSTDLVVTPAHYQKLAERVVGKPEERILSYLMLRSLKQARYSERNLGHFGLASGCYTHFTSPIRRYPDLIVHRILKSLIGPARDESGSIRELMPSPHRRDSGKQPPTSESFTTRPPKRSTPYSNEQLSTLGAESSEAERRADGAERELVEWKKAKFMQERIGEELHGLIIHVNKNGFYVELLDLFIEGIVPVGSLIDDFYVYRESMQCLLGDRSKKSFRIGDRINVLVDRVDADSHKIQFLVADLMKGPASMRRGKRRPFHGRRKGWG
ncbi:MAG: VacB/RNase II family 3'-5' exoribonuclease [Acidobacteriia bacterium]|nr:VacB/RNase II family 3'-5' exoribonuclease [Terriglobia bacterium]